MKEKDIKKKHDFDVHMTEEEKNRVWDGVMRRATDYPDGKSPFVNKPSNWDGSLRRASDFPPGGAPPHALKEKPEGEVEGKEPA